MNEKPKKKEGEKEGENVEEEEKKNNYNKKCFTLVTDRQKFPRGKKRNTDRHTERN